MRRGTTGNLRFRIPFNTNLVEQAFVTLKQCGSIVIEKTLSECILNENSISCRLTQADTLSLRAAQPVDIQLRLLTTSGDALASEIFTEFPEDILKDGEI